MTTDGTRAQIYTVRKRESARRERDQRRSVSQFGAKMVVGFELTASLVLARRLDLEYVCGCVCIEAAWICGDREGYTLASLFDPISD